jgi:tagatose 1,6-diphosphate aldolase
MRRLANGCGRFAMLATDQRPPIMTLIASRTGKPAAFAEIAEAKRLLIETLSPEASAVLVDPVWGYGASAAHLRADRGLIVTLEAHDYAETQAGRRSAAIPGWSAARIRRLGGDAVKVLAWFRPDADPSVIGHQSAFVAECGEQCRQEDIPFVFELLTYPLGAGGAANYDADPRRRPEHVLASVRHFADAAYGVDLWKLESPLPPDTLPDPDSREAVEAQRWFDAIGLACNAPWVLLSGGATPERFARTLTYACRAGASGFLAGRSIWADCFDAFPDSAAVAARLRAVAAPRLRVMAEQAAREARPAF